MRNPWSQLEISARCRCCRSFGTSLPLCRQANSWTLLFSPYLLNWKKSGKSGKTQCSCGFPASSLRQLSGNERQKIDPPCDS